MDNGSIRKTALAMIASHDLCVLATCGHGQPNASLMKYICSAEGNDLYMLTLQESAKHASIAGNPQVSLLIDTRCDAAPDSAESPAGLAPVQALTVYGTARFVTDMKEASEKTLALTQRFPELSELAADPSCVVVHVHAERLLLLDGVNRSSRLTLEDDAP